jgi:hypothetical protein
VKLEARGLTVLDAGSSHGTLVNGERLVSPRLCVHGDRIVIAGHTLLVLDQSRGHREAMPTVDVRRPNAPVRGHGGKTDEVPTGELDVGSRLLSEAHAGIARRDATSAARALEPLVEMLEAAERVAGSDPTLLRGASNALLDAAAVFGRADWIEATIALHSHRQRPMDAGTLDALSSAVERCGAPRGSVLVTYCAALKSRRGPRTAEEDAALDRLAAIAERAMRRASPGDGR